MMINTRSTRFIQLIKVEVLNLFFILLSTNESILLLGCLVYYDRHWLTLTYLKYRLYNIYYIYYKLLSKYQPLCKTSYNISNHILD